MRRLKIRTPLVIHETIDGEVVMVNLETGTYYSLVGTGARIWSILERTATPADVLADLRSMYGEVPALRESVETFLADLEREGLVTPGEATPRSADGAAAGPLDSPEPIRTSSATETAAPVPAFEPPVLERFTDMQELILLDPVHEVEEDKGWPHARPSD